MNFLKRGADFFNTKKELITEELENKTSGLTENINSFGSGAVDSCKESAGQSINAGQQGIGGLREKLDDVTEQAKQKGDSMITEAKGVALGAAPTPIASGVQNSGFLTDHEGTVTASGNEPEVVSGDVNNDKNGEKVSEQNVGTNVNSRLTPGLTLSEINQNYTNRRHLEERFGDTAHYEGKAPRPGEVGTRTDAGLSIMVNQRPSRPNIGDRNVNMVRHNSNPGRYHAVVANKGQVIYYINGNGKPLVARKVHRSKSACVSVVGRNPTSYIQRSGQNRMFYSSFSRPNMADTNRYRTDRQDKTSNTGAKRIRSTSDIQSPNVDRDFGEIPGVSSRNFQDRPASMNKLYESHPNIHEGTVDNVYGKVDEYKTQTNDLMKKGYDLKNELSKDKLLERGKDLRSTYIDSKFGQIGAIPTGMFGPTGDSGTDSGVSEPNPQTNTVPFVGNVGTIDEYKSRTSELMKKGSDLQSELSKDKLLERGKHLRSTYVDSKFGQIGAIPTGMFGPAGDGDTNPDVSEPDTQTNMIPIAGNLSGIMNKPNETMENVRNNLNAENLKQKAFGMFKPWSGSKETSDESNPAPAGPEADKQNGNAFLSTIGVDDKISKGKEKVSAFKDKFGMFGKSKDKAADQTDAVDKPSDGNKTDSNGLNGFMDKFQGFGLPFGGKEESAIDKMKDPNHLENGVFIARFEDTRGPSCNYTVGVIVRLTLVIINALTIVRTITVTNNHWNWGCAPICAIFMALEYSQVVFRRLGREWTWWVPCLLVYLVTTLPLIWQLQINNMGTENGVPKKTDVWTIVASDAIVYLTIFARWLLQGGVVNFGTLASVIMDFIANASDIMDLLSLTDQPEVRASNMLMYWVLGAWSVSFIKFIPLIDIDGKSKDPKRLPKYILVNFGQQFTEALQIIFTLVLLDGSFLVIRIYLLAGEGVVTFSLVFFVVKNMMSIGIQLRRLIAICKSMPCNQKQGDDETEHLDDPA